MANKRRKTRGEKSLESRVEKFKSPESRVRAAGLSQGNAIEAEDAMIAAIAKVHALTVVTGNTRRFERVKGLKLVDW